MPEHEKHRREPAEPAEEEAENVEPEEPVLGEAPVGRQDPNRFLDPDYRPTPAEIQARAAHLARRRERANRQAEAARRLREDAARPGLRQEFAESLQSQNSPGLARDNYFFNNFRIQYGAGFSTAKSVSRNIFAGPRTPDLNRRTIIAQRSDGTQDPINQFYAKGMDDRQRLLSTTPLESSEDAPDGLLRLTTETPTSININWNLGGFHYEGGRGQGNVQVSGMTLEQAEHWQYSYNIPGNGQGFGVGGERHHRTPRDAWLVRDLIFDKSFPDGAPSQYDFNMARRMVELAKSGSPTVFENMAEVSAFYRSTSGRGAIDFQPSPAQNRPWNKTILKKDEEQDVIDGLKHNIPSNRMQIVLRALGHEANIEGLTSFVAGHSMFAFNVGNPTPPRRQVHWDPSPPGSSPYAGYNHTMRAVFEELAATTYSERIDELLLLAGSTLLDSEKIALTEDAVVSYEFYDFETQTKFVNDAYTATLNLSEGTRDAFETAVQGSAFIESGYNFTVPGYEEAIRPVNIPEAALPNMYIYQLATGESTRLDALLSRNEGYDSSPASIEMQGKWDKHIRLGEFIKGPLPSLRGESDAPGGMLSYFSAYASSATNKNVIVDLESGLADAYYNQVTDNSSMNIYAEFNSKKYEFPMFIEIGVPMIAAGSFGTFLGSMLGTTSLVNSFVNVLDDSTNKPFQLISYGVIAPEGIFTLGDEDSDSQLREIETVKANARLKVADLSDWIEGFREGLESQDDLPAELSLRDSVLLSPESFIHNARRRIDTTAKTRMVKYKEFLTGAKTLSDSETIMFKLVKSELVPLNHSAPNGPFRPRKILQNYFFPNTEEIDLIKFVDTQVKYDKYYHYELFAYDVVYGSKFEFRTRAAVYPEPADAAAEGQLAFFSFNVDTKPNVKVIEYPIIFDGWKIVSDQGNSWDPERLLRPANTAQSIISGRPDETVGGVNYPRVKVTDLPPIPPEVSIFSYQDSADKILINLSTTSGEYLDENAIRPVAFDPDEHSYLGDQIANQRSLNTSIPSGKMQYRAAQGPLKMLIYRTESIKTNVALAEHLYKSFSGKLHKVLDTAANPDLPSAAAAYDFLDDIEPGKKYYYTFRTMNYRNQYSNPTAIYEVELISDAGFVRANIKEYMPPISTSKKPFKKATRYLEIKAAELQSLPFQETSQADGLANSRTGFFTSEKSLVYHVGDNGVTANKFIVRVTSRDTGRKIDLVIDVNSTERVIE